MPLYSEAQKTLVVDGKIDVIPPDWDAVQVPRVNGKFCWARMWDAGVISSKNEKIVYLDSDRLLPKNYLQLVDQNVEDDLFLFTSRHFMMVEELPIESCLSILSHDTLEGLMLDEKAVGTLKYEVRHEEPFHGPGKNVMSGSTAFTRKTYLRLGGVDHWYCGHGAFADSDFHMQAASDGCAFLDLEVPELHYPHNKLGDKNSPLKDKELWMLGLDNFIYYCRKWKLPIALAESLAVRSGVNRPAVYVNKRAREIMANAKVS